MEAAAVGWTSYVELERRRKARRLERWNIIDALYQAYVTALTGVIALVWISGVVAEDASSPVREQLVERGPAAIGALAVLAAWFGVRSGLRGGPLTVTNATVRLVLFAPVDRGQVLRKPALKQLRYGAFVGASVGAGAGLFAARRFHGTMAAAVAAGASCGALVGALMPGAALVAASRRVGRARLSAAVIALGLLSAVDLWRGWTLSPLSDGGAVVLSSLTSDVAPLSLATVIGALAAVGVVGVVCTIGTASIGTISVEALERRSQLVTLLRFAATLRDLRGVILFHRLLSQEEPRSQPWMRVPQAIRAPVLRRDLQGVLRWPLVRFARVLALGLLAGLTTVLAIEVAAELVVVAAAAAYVASAEASEGAAQDADHPTLASSLPIDPRALWLRHLVVPTVMMVAFGVAAVAAASVVVGPPALTGLVLVVPAGAFAVATTTRTALQRKDPIETALVILADPTGMAALTPLLLPPLTAGVGVLLLVTFRRAMPTAQPAGAVLAAAAVTLCALAGYLVTFAAVVPWWRRRKAGRLAAGAPG